MMGWERVSHSGVSGKAIQVSLAKPFRCFWQSHLGVSAKAIQVSLSLAKAEHMPLVLGIIVTWKGE